MVKELIFLKKEEGVKELFDLAVNQTEIKKSLDMLKAYDLCTYEHSLNVGRLSGNMGVELNFNKEEINNLIIAGLLHDIGKIYIPNYILNKKGDLTKAEYEIIRKHPIYSFIHVKNYTSLNSEISRIVIEHHEKLDGSGYPKRVRDIHKLAQIIAVADIYDASTSKRVYHEKLSVKTAFEILKKSGVNQYYVNTLRNMVNKDVLLKQ